MEILQEDNGKKGKFYVQDELGEAAQMTYVWSGEKIIIIDHTEVDQRLAGKGIGKQLVKASVEFARAKGIKIIPLCPFAKSVFQREPAFEDVLK